MYSSPSLARHLRKTIAIPKVLNCVISTLREDLHHGPCYRDKWGNETSCFGTEEGIHQFDFVRGCDVVRKHLTEKLPDRFYYETWSGCFTNEIDPSLDYLRIDQSTMLKALVGIELASYVS